MKTRSGESLSPELLAQLKILEAMPDSEIDTQDMPEMSDGSKAERGKFYRPVKKPYSLRLDADVVAWFKASGDGYQTRINAALREYVLRHSKKSA